MFFFFFFFWGGGCLFVCLFVCFVFALHCFCFVCLCFCILKLLCGVNKKINIKIKSGFRVVGFKCITNTDFSKSSICMCML